MEFIFVSVIAVLTAGRFATRRVAPESKCRRPERSGVLLSFAANALAARRHFGIGRGLRYSRRFRIDRARLAFVARALARRFAIAFGDLPSDFVFGACATKPKAQETTTLNIARGVDKSSRAQLCVRRDAPKELAPKGTRAKRARKGPQGGAPPAVKNRKWVNSRASTGRKTETVWYNTRMELKDVELLKVLQSSHVAAPKPVVTDAKTSDCPPVRPVSECKPIWNGEN